MGTFYHTTSFQMFLFFFCTIATVYGVDWSYDGSRGPHHWHKIFNLCTGKKQSPIDIRVSETVFDPSLNEFAIFIDPPQKKDRMFATNNGHTVKITTSGDFFVANGGLPSIYKTAQMHFHWGSENNRGSEHTVNSKSYPLELHIVNYDHSRYANIKEAMKRPLGLAVLGIFFDLTREDNPVLEPIINILEDIKDPFSHEVEIPAMSVKQFLPVESHKYYRYNGSLTTPGCYETVIWTIFHRKQTISYNQMMRFRTTLTHKHNHQPHSPESSEHGEEKQPVIMQPLSEGTEPPILDPIKNGTSEETGEGLSDKIHLPLPDAFTSKVVLSDRNQLELAAPNKHSHMKHTHPGANRLNGAEPELSSTNLVLNSKGLPNISITSDIEPQVSGILTDQENETDHVLEEAKAGRAQSLFRADTDGKTPQVPHNPNHHRHKRNRHHRHHHHRHYHHQISKRNAGDDDKENSISDDHFEKILHEQLSNNYRPVQPLHGRIVYRSFKFEPVYTDDESYDDPLQSKSSALMPFNTAFSILSIFQLYTLRFAIALF